jgi:phospholipid/cholesterol/gamma-HCH transport system permease protein
MASVAATFVESEEPGALVFAAAGEWLVATAAELDRRLRAVQMPSGKRVTLDLAGIDRLDTAGAWLLLRTEHDLTERGNAVEMRNLRPSFEPLIDQVRAAGLIAPARHPRPPYHTMAGFIARIGEVTLALGGRAYSILGFFGVVSATALRLARRPRRLNLTAIAAQMEQTGVNALPIVGLLTFLIGVVASLRADADLADAHLVRQLYGNFWRWLNGVGCAWHQYSGILCSSLHDLPLELLDRHDQVAVLCHHHRLDRLL